eukprot:3220064-Rhodomonas_salina.2
MEVGLGEGPLQRQLAAEKLVHQSVSAETADYEDHTFAGAIPVCGHECSRWCPRLKRGFGWV